MAYNLRGGLGTSMKLPIPSWVIGEGVRRVKKSQVKYTIST
jgi:hypothetical protein